MKKTIGFSLFVILLVYLIKGGITYTYALSALMIWFEKLVPSMFVSMVLVRVLYQMDLLPLLAKPFMWFIKPLFQLDTHAFALVIASLFLGFPTSAILIDEEVQKGYLKSTDARRLINCCCFATPGFIILSCGTVLYHSAQIGFRLFLISFLSGLLLLLLTRGQAIEMPAVTKRPSTPFFHILSASMTESGKALFMIGGYLMIVMSITAVIIPFLPVVTQFFTKVITEFSSGTIIIAESTMAQPMKLAATAALLSFGGLCVHLQIHAMAVHSSLHYPQYLFYRCLQSILSFLMAMLLF